MSRLKRNIPLAFWYSLTKRRHYISILAVYFMTLPDARAQQIGFYIAAGALTSFLTEIPSGYVADRWGHKRVLVLSKIFMLLSTIAFIYAQSIVLFITGSVLLNLSFAATSGTEAAFMHNTLRGLKREKDYTRVMSKMSANVSLLSVLLSVSLPFLTKISMVAPLQASIPIDVAGIIIALSFVKPKQKLATEKPRLKGLLGSFNRMTNPGFWAAAFFVGTTGGFLVAESSFRQVFLESIGYPVILLGFIMGVSRFVWFIVGHHAHKLEERFGLEKILRAEILLFPLLYLLMSTRTNPYVAGAIVSIVVGYRWGREQIVTNHFLTKFIKKEEYKATVLSMKGQVQLLIQLVVAFGFGFIMEHGYRQGYKWFSLGLFVCLLTSWWLYQRSKKH